MPPQNLVESKIDPIINSMQEDEFKNDQLKRQRDGIEKAKQKGVQFGPPKKLTADQIAELGAKRRSGVLIKGLIKEYGVSKATVYRYLEENIREKPVKQNDQEDNRGIPSENGNCG